MSVYNQKQMTLQLVYLSTDYMGKHKSEKGRYTATQSRYNNLHSHQQRKTNILYMVTYFYGVKQMGT